MSNNPQNPIPSNPATMTISNAMTCVHSLYNLFNMLENKSNEEIIHTLRWYRDDMIRQAKDR